MIRIYSVALDGLDSVALQNDLPSSYRFAWNARHERVTNPNAARASLAGVWLLFKTVPNATLRYSELGKPLLTTDDGHEVAVSITHTKTHAFCAVADAEDGITSLGIDAETVGRQTVDGCKKLAARWFSDAEQSCLEENPTEERFLEIWTRKEAYVKLIGTGLRDLRAADTLRQNQSVRFLTQRVGEVILSLAFEGALFEKDFPRLLFVEDGLKK